MIKSLIIGLALVGLSASPGSAQFSRQDLPFGQVSQANAALPLLLGGTVKVDDGSVAVSVDSTATRRSLIGSILNDDPTYNKKLPWYIPAGKVILSNLSLLAIDRYIFNYEFSHVGFNSWKENLTHGFEWDNDRFGMNFFVHPYTGGGYFMGARSSGYSYLESLPFAAGGSLIWEYFGETTKPSYNDLVNTTFNGAFLGEVAYRLTSNILDDRATGPDRAWREISAGLLSPARLISRLIDGKAFFVAESDPYEKEPMNVTISTGAHLANDGSEFGSGPYKLHGAISILYGDPFEIRERKPFDHFKLGVEMSNAFGRKLLDNVTGYGLLTGTNMELGPFHTLVGVFQHFDYFDNNAFELGDLALGGGILSRLPITNSHSLYSNIHMSFIPLAGNSTRFGPIDTTQVRDYNYGSGLQLLTETGMTISKNLLNLSLTAEYILFHTYVGDPGNNYIGIVKPRIALTMFHNIGLGFEHSLYYSNRTSSTFQGTTLVRTEQKFFVQWMFDDFNRE